MWEDSIVLYTPHIVGNDTNICKFSAKLIVIKDRKLVTQTGYFTQDSMVLGQFSCKWSEMQSILYTNLYTYYIPACMDTHMHTQTKKDRHAHAYTNLLVLLSSSQPEVSHENVAFSPLHDGCLTVQQLQHMTKKKMERSERNYIIQIE